jgi:hypothetical protein
MTERFKTPAYGEVYSYQFSQEPKEKGRQRLNRFTSEKKPSQKNSSSWGDAIADFFEGLLNGAQGIIGAVGDGLSSIGEGIGSVGGGEGGDGGGGGGDGGGGD